MPEYNYKQAAEQLWKLLDNIDTLSDICKPTVKDPKAAMAFYNNALRYAGERFKILKSDGYNLFTPAEFEELSSNKESGFFKLPLDQTCKDTQHNPPTHLHIPYGKGYTHICPSCGKKQILIPPQVSF